MYLFQREIHLKPTFGASISYIIVFALSFESKVSNISLVMLLVFDLSFESETHAAGEKLLGLPEANCTTRFAPT